MPDESNEATGLQRRRLAPLGNVAATVDRWFLSCIGPFGALGQQASRAVDTVVSSTTSLTRSEKLERLRSRARALTQTDPAEATADPAGRFELLSATPYDEHAGCVKAAAERSGAAPVGNVDAQEPAGLVPLLRALAAVVKAHGPVGYRTLADDPRFWPLVELIASFQASVGTQDPGALPRGGTQAPGAEPRGQERKEEGPCTHSG